MTTDNIRKMAGRGRSGKLESSASNAASFVPEVHLQYRKRGPFSSLLLGKWAFSHFSNSQDGRGPRLDEKKLGFSRKYLNFFKDSVEFVDTPKGRYLRIYDAARGEVRYVTYSLIDIGETF